MIELYLLLSLVACVIASFKNRSVIGWFVLSILISPFATCLIVLVLPRKGLVNAD